MTLALWLRLHLVAVHAAHSSFQFRGVPVSDNFELGSGIEVGKISITVVGVSRDGVTVVAWHLSHNIVLLSWKKEHTLARTPCVCSSLAYAYRNREIYTCAIHYFVLCVRCFYQRCEINTRSLARFQEPPYLAWSMRM